MKVHNHFEGKIKSNRILRFYAHQHIIIGVLTHSIADVQMGKIPKHTIKMSFN